MKHIGIVACSAEGAALCYRTICAEGGEDHPEITMHTHPLRAYMECIRQNDWRSVGALMVASAERVMGAGADLLICPDNTIHQAMPFVKTRVPWLHIAEVVAEEAAARGFRKVGLTGTKWLVESEVYPEKLAARGIEFVRPNAGAREEMNRLIMDELVAGILRRESIVFFEEVILGLAAAGCDAVVLGCTEIPLIMNDGNSALPTLDSTRLLARASLRAAAGPRDDGRSPR